MEDIVLRWRCNHQQKLSLKFQYYIYRALHRNYFINPNFQALQDVGYGGMDRIEGHTAGTCECGNEHSGSIKGGEFLHYLKTG